MRTYESDKCPLRDKLHDHNQTVGISSDIKNIMIVPDKIDRRETAF